MIARIRVGPDARAVGAAAQFGHQLPNPEVLFALIDTGCTGQSGIEVYEPTMQRLGLNVTNLIGTQTVLGDARRNVYSGSVAVLSAEDTELLVLPTAELRALPRKFDDFEALIGWGVLRETRLVVDGPRRSFSLEFSGTH
jgi:hypothetical protein